jgi:AraC-like DNA-binding protein
MSATSVPLTIAALTGRERTRALLRHSFPRQQFKVQSLRSAPDLERLIRSTLVDAVLVDMCIPSEEGWRALGLAREFPSAPFFAVVHLRPSEAAVMARCATEVADLIVEPVDDRVVRDLVVPRAFSARFARALAVPPASLGLGGELLSAAWRHIVLHAGRPVTTAAVAKALGVTREHLSRSFSSRSGANLKRVIDLVRLVAAAELCKNPGYDVADVARVLDYASPSHLSTAAQRIAGTRAAHLARLRAVDVIERFVRGRTRSRRSPRPE